jgi:hypothetical protein
MTEPATIHTVEHGDPSPVPESNWAWRRAYTFTVTGLLLAHVGWTSYRTSDVLTLRETIRNDQALILLFALLYLAGASAEAIGRIVASVRTSRKETITSAPAPATLTSSLSGSSVAAGEADGAASATTAATVPDRPAWERG